MFRLLADFRPWAVVSGAMIDARNTPNGEWNYLPGGKYRDRKLYGLAVAGWQLSPLGLSAGFQEIYQVGHQVEVAQIVRIDTTLEVGKATESVTVQADSPLLKTERCALSHNVNTNFLDELPIFRETATPTI